MIAGDQARVSVQVAVPQDVAFRIFTEDIDRWWRRGLKYRVAGKRRGFLHLEPRAGGKVYERFAAGDGERVFQTGTVTAWEPPARLVFEWRSVTFVDGEATEVEVTFTPRRRAGAAGEEEHTVVTVTHRGWSKLRADHPVRHGRDAVAFLRWMGMWWGELMTSLREHAASGGGEGGDGGEEGGDEADGGGEASSGGR